MRSRPASPLRLAACSLLLAACSAGPTETTGAGDTRLVGGPRPMSVSTQLLTRASPDGQITNGNGGCLDLPNGDTRNGNLLHIWTCDSSGWNQTWYVDPRGSIHYAANPTKCVDFPAQYLSNGVPVNETQLQIWDCNDASGPDQVWQFSWTNNIQFASAPSKCVELRNGSHTDGTQVQVYDCNGTTGQTWTLVTGGGVQGFQLQDGNGACLDAPAAAAGTGLVLAPCNATGTNQTWGMDGKGGLFNYATGLYATFPARSLTPTSFVPGTQLVMENGDNAQDQVMALSSWSHTLLVGNQACVEARNGSATNGTIVEGFTCNGTPGQTWFPRPVGGACPATHPDGSGVVVMNGQCVECGLKGQSVCPDGTCRPGGVAVNGLSGVTAVNGTCVACGEKGQPPCAGSTCDPLAYLVPVNGACVPNPSVLGPSEMLVGGQSLVARDCAYHLDMQKDGNLVLYQGPGNSASSARWSLGTTYNAGAGAIMQSDGNFVLYDTGKVDLSQTDTMYVVWSTQTFGQYGAFATVQDDGNFVVYKGGTALWASNTAGSALGQTCALRAHTTHIETGYFALGPVSSVKNGLSMVQCASTAPGCAAVLYDGITLGTGDCSCLSSVTGWEPSTALVSMWVESD